MDVVHLVDQGGERFEQDRFTVQVVCAGDSLTGWNNFGPAEFWPCRTYPEFLQHHCLPLGLRVANCGIAGEVSDNGIGQVTEYLNLFPNASYFVIGFGTNDLGTWPDLESTSRRIIANLDQMVRAVVERSKQPILFNVPYANESSFSGQVARETHAKRDYHNARLNEFCGQRGVPLADICSRLRDEHFGDELHPNSEGARIIAEEVFEALLKVHPGTMP